MDFTGISLAGPVVQILALALIVVGGYAAIWAVDKVIGVIRGGSDRYVDSDTGFNYGPPE